LGHKKGRRKREKALREKLVVERALGIQRKGFCPICGKKLVNLRCDDAIFDALESGKCPRCSSLLRFYDNGVVQCPNCRWAIYIQQ
jgi:transcription initiation factor IIE alpha subunit